MLPKRYNPRTREPEWRDRWREQGTHRFQPDSSKRLFTIDTPPPTVSGNLHLGHVYSYSQTDFLARYRRMCGDNVYYPMGFDDNGLPTERLVERQLGIRAQEIGRERFIQICLEESDKAEEEYEALWRRLGLSIDWDYTYQSIGETARRISQWSFLDLLQKGLVYRKLAPTLWCPTCQTAIAQADVGELTRDSEYVTLAFRLPGGQTLPIATTRPELLPACVAIFVHPDDERFRHLIGQEAHLPYFDRPVPILADAAADPDKGTGAVMCCTFGDSADVTWWRTHGLPLIEAIGPDGHMTAAAAPLSGLKIAAARAEMKRLLRSEGLLSASNPTEQTVSIHDRCDTPIEYIQTAQWFVNVLAHKERLLAAADEIEWRPAHMKARYQQWVSNLSWDWCISRQRYFGVTFPIWYCDACGHVRVAEMAKLPLDPTVAEPAGPCRHCGGDTFTPETDVMDTWATSSMTPQIVASLRLDGDWQSEEGLPCSLRPQAHEIIRTWTFYTIVKSLYHFDQLPWTTVALSGWGLAPEGEGKISKSRQSDVAGPMAMIEKYSADAVRYWAASTGLGKDSRISEEKIQAGAKLVTKLWNVARFSQRFIAASEGSPPTHRVGGDPSGPYRPDGLSLGDRWLLSRLHRLIKRTTELMDAFDYAAAKAEIESFFWHDLADNYLEMSKQRLYEQHDPAAAWTLQQAILTQLKLFAPILPFVTEQIYQLLFATHAQDSIHVSAWPTWDAALIDDATEAAGSWLLEIASAVRRYKSEKNLSLGVEIGQLTITGAMTEAMTLVAEIGGSDLKSITRASVISFKDDLEDEQEIATWENGVRLGLK